MKFRHTLLLSLFSLTFISLTQAQLNQYNFFVGPDAKLMQTTAKGLGSWNMTGYMSLNLARPMNEEKKSGLFFGGGLGVYYKKFRFKNNLVLQKVGDILVATPDNPDWYSDGFFSYSKSKLVLFTTTLQPEIGFFTSDRKFAIGIAPRVDFTLGAKHKRKYTVNDEKIKFKDTGIKDYDINPIQIGVNVRVGSLKFGVEASYMISPFFASAGSPQVQVVSVGIYTRIVSEKDEDEDSED